jgi:UDP-N-acetylmuramate dehydrogenase
MAENNNKMSLEKAIKKNYDLTPLTTFKIGGRAEFFAVAKNRRELIEAVNWAKIKKLPLLFIAGGSNILITKKKITGLVIKISGDEYSVKGNSLSAWAGTSMSKLAGVAADSGLSGLEWALGIPGSVGGAVRGNAGAYGSDISGQVAEVEAYDLTKDKLMKFNHQSCGFSYRHSVFKQKKNLLIIKVEIKLNRGKSAEIKKLARKNLLSRKRTNPKEPSAGCIFKNLEYNKLIEENRELAEYLIAKGLFRNGKIGAGYLIGELKLKGKAVGGSKISEKHANFIVNTGHANANNVIALVNLIKKKVKNHYGINLDEEIVYFGG